MNYITAGVRVFVDRTYEYINTFSNDISDNNIQPLKKRIFLKVPMVTQVKTFLSPPTYIVNGIYLGSAFNASNKELLDYYNIKYIINVTNEISNYYPEDITYVNYKIYDNNKDKISDFLDDSYIKLKEFINNNNGNILVHCFMGASRSATVVAHYLIKEFNLSPELAIINLKEKRITINLTNRFYNDLQEKYKRDNFPNRTKLTE